MPYKTVGRNQLQPSHCVRNTRHLFPLHILFVYLVLYSTFAALIAGCMISSGFVVPPRGPPTLSPLPTPSHHGTGGDGQPTLSFIPTKEPGVQPSTSQGTGPGPSSASSLPHPLNRPIDLPACLWNEGTYC